VAAVLASAVAAAPAGAATVTKDGATITYTAADFEVNNLKVSLQISLQGPEYVFQELGSAPVNGRCENMTTGLSSATCGATGVTEIVVLLHDDNDGLTVDGSVAGAGPPLIVAEGGTGMDTLTGSDGPEWLCGGPGNDTLNGGGGNDRLDFPCVNPQEDQTPGADWLSGGPGDDQLNGGPAGAPLEGDKLFGGDGTDTADYSLRVARLTITLDGLADDGEAGEGDNVAADVENVIGGSDRDVLVGSGAANVLDGRGADDQLFGRGGNDRLEGGAGNDTLMGEEGNDALIGTDGDDHLIAGDGDDDLSGGGGTDVLEAGAGRDTLAGGPGGDTLAGGDGNDSLDGAEPGLIGGDGNDTLDGGSGADGLRGGPGNDDLDGGLGPDVINGDDGEDTLRYRDRANGVIVSLDGRANDGEPFESDNVASDVEIVVGGSLEDTFTGDRLGNKFEGQLGEDFLDGKAGADTLDAGAGSDLVWARDGTRDTVDCGGGGDLAVLDRNDDARNCRWWDKTGHRNPVAGRFARVSGSAFTYSTPVGTRAYRLNGSLRFPIGSTMNARTAAVHVTTVIGATDVRQHVSVSGGPFKVMQATRRSTPVYKFAVGPRRCSRGGPRAPADARTPRIVMQVEKPKRRGGRPPKQPQAAVQGAHSLGSAFATKWITEERCSGTFTRVVSGVVRVRDLGRKRTRFLRKGQTYLARAD
jgi:Ca2+-binding RTX toxin-like protein